MRDAQETSPPCSNGGNRSDGSDAGEEMSHRKPPGSDDAEEMSYREAWSSRASGCQKSSPVAGAAALTGRAADLKQAGNDAFATGKVVFAALKCCV